MQERHDKLFDIQFFADDGDESDDGKNKGGGSGGDPVILAEELTAGEFETLDKTFRRAYVEKDGKYYLNRKGRDVLSEALKKEREYREKAENALKGLGMSVEDAKKLLDDHKKQKEQSKTEAERMQEAIENARKESDATKAASSCFCVSSAHALRMRSLTYLFALAPNVSGRIRRRDRCRRSRSRRGKTISRLPCRSRLRVRSRP